MTLDDLWHVFQLDARVPDVVWIDEYYGTFLVAAGASVTEHGGRRSAPPLHLFLESFE